jgi:hypothetical protein
MVLIDHGRTHNFIHRCITQETHCSIHDIKKIQIMIVNWGSMRCGNQYENMKLQMVDYFLIKHVFH